MIIRLENYNRGVFLNGQGYISSGLKEERGVVKHLFAVAAFLGCLGGIAEAMADTPLAYQGRRLFVSYCQLCHGEQGKGDGPLAKQMEITPADLTTTVRSRSDTILKKIISGRGRQTITGRDRHNLISEAMPKWTDVFSDTQIDALIAFLRFLSRSEHRLMGDPEIGQDLYQLYCATCHGEYGEGDGPMTQLINIEPADHSNANVMRRIDNDELVRSIQLGRGRYMPGWKGVLTDEEIEALVSYIRLLSN